MADVPSIPDLTTLCVEVLTGPGALCVTFPGGATMCASVGVETGDPGAIIRGFLSQIAPALMPLAPFFNVLDVLKAVQDCITAVPKAIFGDVKALVDATTDLAKKLGKLLAMLPQFTVPVLVKGILSTIIAGLLALKVKMQAMIRQAARIAAATTRAAQLGGGIGAELQVVVSCAQANLEAQLANESASLDPLNRLIGFVNILLKLVPGLPCIPTLGGLGAVSEAALDLLDGAIKTLQFVDAALPIDLSLPPIPGPDDPC